MPQHLGQVVALVQQPVSLTQVADNLLGGMAMLLHRGDVLLPSMLGDGLPHTVDHYPGTRSHARSGGRFWYFANAGVMETFTASGAVGYRT